MSDVSDVPPDLGNRRGESVATEPPRTPTPPNDNLSTALTLPFRTPIKNKASSTILPTLSHSPTGQAHKAKKYDMKVCHEVDPGTAEVSYDKFMELASGASTGSLTSEQLTQIGDFSELASKSLKLEWQMYPIFVSPSRHLHMVVC